PPETDRMTVPMEAIERVLWPRGSGRDVWAILDGARDRRISFDLLNSYQTYTCLYSGDLAPDLERTAPYLVQLECDDRYTRNLLRNAWGKNWGVFLKSDASINQLRRHLRTFLVVRGPTGKRLVFRYYDPRVLRVYLPTCVQDELRTVFGPIASFWTESPGAGSLLQFEFDRRNLSQREIPLNGG
ncbi:MAG: DUF4123 domain-containing protein, partial [Bryobacteraceae bacterium]